MSAEQAKAMVGRFVVCKDPKKPSLKGPRLLTKVAKSGLCVLDYIHHVAPKYVEEMPK